jgi:hypothetical protein
MLSVTGPADRADQMTAMAARLTDLIRIEIQALKSHRLDGAAVHMEEKERLVHAWRLEVARIKQDPSLLQGIDPGRKAALRDASKTLEVLIEGHAHALEAMKTVTEGLVKAIATEVAAARKPPTGYGANGATGRPATSSAASGIAVNTRI